MTEAHESLTDELRAAAAEYALGLLEGDEELAFSRHLEECPACRGEVEVTSELALAAPLRSPRPELRQRILESLKPRQYMVTRAGDGAWIPFGVPGIHMKALVEDAAAGTRSFLLRLDPGAVLPAHKHRGAEHCYVIEGEVFDHEHSLSAGDYELRLAGSGHAAVGTKNGAIVLIMAGSRDERH